MEKIIEIPEGYEARIEGNKVVLEPKNEDEMIRRMIDDTLHQAIISEFISETSYRKMSAYLEKQKEQKPAEWSEEDKDYYDAIIAKLEITQDDALLTDNQINFLKSLPERFNLQPKQEWGKKCPHYSEGYGCEISPMKKCESCEKRPRWKPSEEQMEWLEQAVKLSADKPAIHGVILSLYDDLKRLM